MFPFLFICKLVYYYFALLFPYFLSGAYFPVLAPTWSTQGVSGILDYTHRDPHLLCCWPLRYCCVPEFLKLLGYILKNPLFILIPPSPGGNFTAFVKLAPNGVV